MLITICAAKYVMFHIAQLHSVIVGHSLEITSNDVSRLGQSWSICPEFTSQMSDMD